MAQKAGVAEHDAPNLLAGLLPNLVDKLTPTGQVPAENDLASMGMNLLKGIMGGK